MDLAISILDERLTLVRFFLKTKQAVSIQGKPMSECEAELEQAIAILKQHSAKAPTAPPELVRDYPHSSD